MVATSRKGRIIAADRSWRRVARLALVVVLWVMVTTPRPAAAAVDFYTLPDFPIPNGHFFSQASGRGETYGFGVTNDDGILFYDEFLRLGGAERLGYPASQRFVLDGFVVQATQKQLLQWHPESGRADFVNIFDVFSDRGLDPILAQTRLIPPTGDNTPDAHLPWPQIVARHLALLDHNPAIRTRYFADPNPIADFGLPQSVGDFGGVFVIRCERAAFQQWRVPTSFARPGDVTQVNAGDLAKEFGVVPAVAATPVGAEAVLVAPPGVLLVADAATQAAARRSSAVAASALVRIDVTFPGGVGVASGILVDGRGNVLTNEHVVDTALTIKVTLANGVSTPARVVGVDAADDLAVVRVPTSALGGVTPANMVGGGQLSPGQFVVALGYTPYFPGQPSTRLGLYQRSLDFGIPVLRSDTYILPGDSGGMLLDLSGNVVGVNDEIRFTQQSDQPLIGFSIDAAAAMRIAQRLILSAAP